jgi:hypothetical protein
MAQFPDHGFAGIRKLLSFRIDHPPEVIKRALRTVARESGE